MATCPQCGNQTLVEAVEVEVCQDESCGYGFRYRD